MCLTHCLCLIPNGFFEGSNVVIAFMKFLLGKLWRLAYRACPCIVAARRVGKMRTRWPRHTRSRRVAPLSAGRVGEATHPGPAYTKHHRCPHYPTWLSLPCSRFLFLTLFSFLVAFLRCRAPWFDGTNEGPCLSDVTGSQQQRVTRSHCSAATPISGTVELAGLSAEREKGTVKTQAYHTPATNSDASPVHPVDDSARETAKAQARHSPATCTVFSTIHPAADSA